jgi:ABC-type oligopeptide transport system substrate-binding subunit
MKGLIVLMTAALVLSACNSGGSGEKVLHVAREVATNTLNYLTNEMVNNGQVIANFSEGLVTYDTNGKLIPGLAHSWDHNENIYTFTLRDGLTWSNGTALTAADFVFGWQTVATLEEAPYSYFMADLKNGAAVVAGNAPASDLGVKALDETTLEVTLEQDRVYFMDILAHSAFLPLNEAFYSKVGADNYGTDATSVIASGAFTLSEYNPSEGYTLEKNPRYWNAQDVALDKVYTHVVKESATQDTLYMNDELDVLEVPANLYDKYKDDTSLVEMSYHRLYYLYVSGNTGTPAPVLANADFRRALSYAIDKEVLATNVFKDGTLPLDYVVPKDFASVEGKPYRTFVGEGIDNTYKFDVAKAQDYLAKAAAALGETELTLRIAYQDKEENKRVFESVQAQLETNLPGVKVNLESVPSQAYFKEVLKKATPAGYMGWTPSYNDMASYFLVFLSDNSLNFSGYNNPEFDALYKQAQEETNAGKRAHILHEAETMLLNDSFIIPLGQRGKRYVVKEKVKGFNFSSTYPEIKFQYMDVV